MSLGRKTCSCGATIFMVEDSKTGSHHPIRKNCDAEGNIVIVVRGGEVKAHVCSTPAAARMVAKTFGIDPTHLYKSHFAECRDAEKHRRPAQQALL